MPIPPFVVELRALVGTRELWLPGRHRGRTSRRRADTEVLLTLRADNGEWAPVTGILDPGEEPAVGAAREALEETGVVVSVDRLASVSVSPQVVHANGDLGVYLDLTFACTWVSRRGAGRRRRERRRPLVALDALPPMADWLVERIDDVLAGETAARFRT